VHECKNRKEKKVLIRDARPPFLWRAGYGADMQEISVVTSPGARQSAWAIKVKSNSSYNVYNVVVIEIAALSKKTTFIRHTYGGFSLAL